MRIGFLKHQVHFNLKLLTIILLINNSSCDTSNVFSQEFTDQFFLVQPSEGWQLYNQKSKSYQPYTQQTICGSVSIFGGFCKLGAASQLEKVFSSIPPHYELEIDFKMYFLDNQNTSANNVYITLDNLDGGSFTQSKAAISNQICGLKTIDRVWNYSNTFSHSNPTLTLKFRDTFDQTPNQVSWGIREVYLRITGLCDASCAKCSGPNANQCLACQDGSKVNKGNCSSKSSSGSTQNGSSSKNNQQDWTACDTSINNYAQNFMYSKQSEIQKDAVTFQQQMKISVKINFQNANVPANCRNQIINKIYYQNADTELIPFPDNCQSLDLSTYTLQLKFNLEDANQYSRISTCQDRGSLNSVYIIIMSGNSKQMVRSYKFELFIVFSGEEEQINSYLIDINDNETSGNCVGQQNDCQVIADLPIQGTVCKDEACKQIYQPNQQIIKQISDYLIVRFRFTDPTYTQKLNVIQVIYKGGNTILDLSPQTTVLFNDSKGTVIVKTLLVDASQNALFQYNLKIGDKKRNLQQGEQSSVTQTQSVSSSTTMNDSQSYQFIVTITKNGEQVQVEAATYSYRIIFMCQTAITILLISIF